MKPDVKTAMANLIREAREKIPFHLSFDGNCEGRCDGCPYKLMEFLDMDLSDWELRLKRGDIPTIGDLHTLGRSCQELYNILKKEGHITEPPASS